jgi:hypothetical protein
MTVTLPATTAGNLVVVAWLQNVDQVINSVTDTAGNTYSVAVSRFAGGAAGVFSIYYKENAAGIGSTNTITLPSQVMLVVVRLQLLLSTLA